MAVVIQGILARVRWGAMAGVDEGLENRIAPVLDVGRTIVAAGEIR